MNTYSRALRHIDMKDVKQKHQQKLIENEIKKEQEKKYLEELTFKNSPEYSNWRSKISEQMTTADVFYTTLPATGDVDLTNPQWNITGGVSYSSSGSSATITNTGVIGPGGVTNGFISLFDTSYYDTLVFDVQITGNTILTIDSSGFVATSSGTYSIAVSQSKSKSLSFLSPALSVGTVTISDLRFQRRTPLNVFVGLDDPEASSFIRTGSGDLSPEEKQKKLKEMLEASDEYVMKMLGLDFPGTGAVPPGEFDPFAQTPPGEAGDTPGVEISQMLPFPSYPAGPSGYKAPGTYDPSKIHDYAWPYDPSKGIPDRYMPSPNLPQTGPGLSQSSQDTQIAQNTEPLKGQRTDVRYDPTMKMFVPRPSDKDSGTNIQDLIKQAKRNQKQTAMVAHYEPQGQVLSEKKLKSPKEILNKIPGYYDGKPAPLGFPETPPPEMKNGMHPDLVDGKNVANRFNRLDPISAKAMPLTGNPHIDKKVKAARKKPK